MNDVVATGQAMLDLETGLTKLITSGFEAMNARFDRLELHADVLERRINNLEALAEALKERMGQAESSVEEIEIQLRSLAESHGSAMLGLDGMDEKLRGIENDIKEMYDFVAEVRGIFVAHLQHNPAQEKRLRRLEVFAQFTASRLGLKSP